MKSVHIHELFKVYQAARREIQTAHEKGADGLVTARRLTQETDKLILNIFDLLDPAFKKPVAILALGGYGRCELCPHSDIDLLILYPDASSRHEAQHSSMAFLHLLFDVGFNIGHAFRSFHEMLALHKTDFDSWAALLEARYLYGNSEVYDRFVEVLNEDQSCTKDLAFIHHVIEQQKIRHRKYGNSVKLLEPNVKQSAGGLRDIHALLWMFRSLKEYPLPLHNDADSRYHSLSKDLIREFRDLGKIDTEQCNRVVQAYDYILRVRHQLHFTTDNTHDNLDFGLQEQVALKLGYRNSEHKRAVESFMQEYYIRSREIRRFNDLFTQMYADLYRPPRKIRERILNADELYTYDGHQIGISEELPEKFQLTGIHMIRAFVHLSKYGLPFDNRARTHTIEHAPLVDESVQRSQEAGTLFSAIFNHPHPAFALRNMYETGILERFIPEFHDLVAFFQHNQYHYYTADEHTIITLEKLQALSGEDSLLGEVYRNLKNKEPLYLAALFHDIAKPRRINDHEIIGADMAEEILNRIQRPHFLDDVQFLIRHHLMMEQVAFRRNIYEPETIEEFSSRFSSHAQLDMLFLLTYADLSAVNPKIWTDWKSQLLQDLYLRTSEHLSKLTGELRRFDRYRSSVNQIIRKISAYLPEDSIREHIDQFDDRSYIASFSDKEITQHIESIQQSYRSGASVTMHYTHHHAFTELTIITMDRPYALSDFCGILTAHDANIIDANIFTRSDGIIIDKFRVVDFVTEGALSDETCGDIKKKLDELTGNTLTDIERLIERQRKKWKRKLSKITKTDQPIRVAFDTTPHHTIIDVYGPDILGMLFVITRTLSELGLNIYFAKIASRVDGIVDSFYVLTQSGERVPGDRYDEIRKKIEHALQPLLPSTQEKI
jgi:[protein-PII] uridylyltransferase